MLVSANFMFSVLFTFFDGHMKMRLALRSSVPWTDTHLVMNEILSQQDMIFKALMTDYCILPKHIGNILHEQASSTPSGSDCCCIARFSMVFRYYANSCHCALRCTITIRLSY